MFAVRYFVVDVARAVSFYRDVFSFELVQQYGPAMAVMNRENMTLWLAGPLSSAQRAEQQVSDNFNPGVNRIVFLTHDVGSQIDRAIACGGNIHIGLTSGPMGEQAVLEDPDGNYIEVYSSS